MFIGEYFAIWYDACGGKQAIEAISKRAQQDAEQKERDELVRLLAKYGAPAAPSRPSAFDSRQPADGARGSAYLAELARRNIATPHPPENTCHAGLNEDEFPRAGKEQ